MPVTPMEGHGMTLSTAGFIVSGLFGLAGLAILLLPAPTRRMAAAFPRHRWAGRLLSAVALLIVARAVLGTDLGRFNGYKPALYLLTPMAIGLVGWLLEELLAARALGGLLLLGSNPILAAARADTPWRIALSLAAYAAVVAGMALVVGPHWFRRASERTFASQGRAILTGSVALGLGFGFLLLALGPYRGGA